MSVHTAEAIATKKWVFHATQSLSESRAAVLGFVLVYKHDLLRERLRYEIEIENLAYISRKVVVSTSRNLIAPGGEEG
jgi:hypothetical protein